MTLKSRAAKWIYGISITLITLGELQSANVLPPLEDGEYTVVVIPDTQAYLGKGTKRTPKSEDPVTNVNLEKQVSWILQHHEDQRIVFVTHVGDIVDRNIEEQWEVADRHLSKLIGQVPLSLTVGNHDMESNGDSSLFQKYFGTIRFDSFAWYLGSFSGKPGQTQFSGNNANSAQWIDFGGQKVLHFSLECNAPDRVLDWAREMTRAHSDKDVWITTHMDLGIIEKPKTHEEHIHGLKGRMRWRKNHGKEGNTPEDLWKEFYREESNIRLILSGDQSRVTARRSVDLNRNGKAVHSLLSDYVSNPVLRLMRYQPKTKQLKVLTLDLASNELLKSSHYVKEEAQHQFKVNLDGASE